MDAVVAMEAEAERRLRTFNEKAAELNDSWFLGAVRSGKTSYVWHMGAEKEVDRNLPHREEIKSFVVTFRLFLQDRPDRISVKEIDALYEKLDVPQGMRDEVKTIRTDLNTFLDGKTPLVLKGEHLSRRRVMDTMLYGGIAHVNPKKQPEYERWRRDEVLFTAIEAEFVDIVSAFTQAVFWIRQVNLKALDHLKQV